MDIPAPLESRIRRVVRIRFRTLQAADLEDAEGEALARVLEVDGAAIRGANPWPYIERTAVNAVIEMLRAKHRTQEVLYGDVPEVADVDAPDQTDRVEAVMRVLESQHPAWAQTARLCAEGATMNQIARMMNVSPTTPNTRMFRVRALARTVALGLLLCLPSFGATYSTGSGPVYVAVTAPTVETIEPIQTWTVASAEAFYSLQPVTVTCKAIYLEPCPIGEVFVWGTVGASQYYTTPDAEHKSFFKFNDTRSAQDVVVYTQTRMYQGQRGRAHIIVEAKGRGVLMDFLVVAEGGL